MKVREIIKIIEDDGWIEVRQTGSHRQFKNPLKSGGVTVAGHLSRDLPIGLSRAIIKQAGLNQRKS